VSYCDSTGNPFHEAYNAVPFYAETNYPDVLCVNKTADGKGNVHIKVCWWLLLEIIFSWWPCSFYFDQQAAQEPAAGTIVDFWNYGFSFSSKVSHGTLVSNEAKPAWCYQDQA